MTPGGNNCVQRCLNALEEMQSVGLFQLPEKQTRTKVQQKPLQWSDHTDSQPAINGNLSQFNTICVKLVTEQNTKKLFNEYIDRYHYLGYRRPIGNHLRYFIIGQNDQADTLLGCLLFTFAVNKLECRDQWIGWNDNQREKHLPLIINNSRFLIFPGYK